MARMLIGHDPMGRRHASSAAKYRRRGHSRRARGFTLVELLVVVAMVGILAALAIVGYRKYVASAGTSEAMAMIQLIRHGETQYKLDALQYLGCSSALNDTYPMATPSHLKYTWEQTGHADYQCWRQLNVRSDGALRFGYAVMAGDPGAGMPSPVNFSPALGALPVQTEPWFVIQATGNRDDDSEVAVLLGVSWINEVYMENDTE